MYEDEFNEEATKYYPKVYLCDPKKNKDCPATICYAGGKLAGEDHGVCRYTRNPEYSKDGKAYFYDPDTNEFKEAKK